MRGRVGIAIWWGRWAGRDIGPSRGVWRAEGRPELARGRADRSSRAARETKGKSSAWTDGILVTGLRGPGAITVQPRDQGRLAGAETLRAEKTNGRNGHRCIPGGWRGSRATAWRFPGRAGERRGAGTRRVRQTPAEAFKTVVPVGLRAAQGPRLARREPPETEGRGATVKQRLVAGGRGGEGRQGR